MLILALDTATPRTEVALLEERPGDAGPDVLAEHSEPARNHSVTLLPAIDSLLKGIQREREQLGLVAAGIGPGSFTGVRVGLTLAKTLSYSLEIPLVGISTLRALARNGVSQDVELVCPVQDALKNEVYTALYRLEAGRLAEQEPEAARDPRAWAEELGGRQARVLLIGTGVDRYREELEQAVPRAVMPDDENLHQVKAREIGRLALERFGRGEQDDPAALEPNYCRLSEAEVARTGPKAVS
jgi:tRNA threonylcarbamoyladenosine biosynthesis protein TsaB